MNEAAIKPDSLLDFSCKKKFFDYFLDYLNEPISLDSATEFLLREFSSLLKTDNSLIALYSNIMGYYLIKEYTSENIKLKNSLNLADTLYINWHKYFINNELSFIEYNNNSDILCKADKDYLILNNLKSLLVFPIYYKAEFLGLIVVQQEESISSYHKQQIDVISFITKIISNIIKQTELAVKTKNQVQRNELLFKITTKIRETLDVDEVKKEIVNAVSTAFNIDRCFIRLFDDANNSIDKEYLSSPDVKSVKQYNFTDGFDKFVKTQLKEKKFLIVPDTEYALNNPNLNNFFKNFIKDLDIKSNYGFAIYNNNELIGAFVIHYTKRKVELNSDDIELLSTISNQAGIAIKQAELYSKTKKQAEREILIRRITETLRNTLDINEMKKNIATEIGRAFEADRCAVCQFDTEKDKFLRIDKYSEYLLSSEEVSFMGIDIEDKKNSFFKNLYSKKKELLAPKWNDYLDNLSKISDETKKNIKKFNIKSKYVFPITYADNLLGILYLIYSKEEKIFLNEELELIRTLVNQVGIAFYQAKLYLKFRQNNTKEKLLRKIMDEIRQTDNIDEILYSICNDTAKILNAKRILIIDYKRIINKPVILKEFLAKKSLKPFNFTDHCNLWNYIKKNTVNNKGKIEINNIEESLLPDNVREECTNLEIKSFFCRPLRTEENNSGCIVIFNHLSNKEWSTFEINLIKQVSDYISIALKEATLYSQSNFIANISHEIKTPLTILEGYSDALMKDDISKSKEAKDYIWGIKNNIDRINNIIETFLFISRLEKDYEEDKIQFYNYNLKEILEFAVNLCDKQSEQKGIKIKVVCNDNIVVKANMLLLQQAVFNLIQNAIKHSENLDKISVQGYEISDEIVIKVIDNGCGIAKDQLSKIFDKFYRIDKSRSRATGGTGLGLSIVKLIAQVHKGYVYVESTVEAGSSFYIYLPKGS